VHLVGDPGETIAAYAKRGKFDRLQGASAVRGAGARTGARSCASFPAAGLVP
jgi:hypothetical protein